MDGSASESYSISKQALVFLHLSASGFSGAEDWKGAILEVIGMNLVRD